LDFSRNLNCREITALRHVRFLGESVSVAVGVPNPWMLDPQSTLAFQTAWGEISEDALQATVNRGLG
jgi:hypothetical protein